MNSRRSITPRFNWSRRLGSKACSRSLVNFNLRSPTPLGRYAYPLIVGSLALELHRQSRRRPWHAFTDILKGIPGIETRLPLFFSAPQSEERLNLSQFVDITTTTPAKLYGLYLRNGVIAIGSDADFAIRQGSNAMPPYPANEAGVCGFPV